MPQGAITNSGTLAEIQEAQRAHTEELKVIKGQLTDLPGITSRLASTRMDLRHDIRELRDQVAELPGIRTRLEEQDRQLSEIRDQLTTIISILTDHAAGGPDTPNS